MRDTPHFREECLSCFHLAKIWGVKSTLAGDRTRTSGSGDLCDIHFTTRAFVEPPS